MTTAAIDLDRLLKLRLIIARYGEMDLAKWWNSRGQLGRLGAAALKRGFPRSYRFAQARSLFAVASQRCSEVFEPPAHCHTLWQLPEDIEQAFDARWERWLDQYNDWFPFFEKLESIPAGDLATVLRSFDTIGDLELDGLSKLRRSSGGRVVTITKPFTGKDEDISLLALGFARGETSALAVPHARRASI